MPSSQVQPLGQVLTGIKAGPPLTDCLWFFCFGLSWDTDARER